MIQNYKKMQHLNIIIMYINAIHDIKHKKTGK